MDAAGEAATSLASEDLSTALHEAGHVIVCYAVGGVVQTTTVEPDDPGLAGCAPCQLYGSDVYGRVLVGTAGLAAENLYGPDARPDAPFRAVLKTEPGGYFWSDVRELVDYLCQPVVVGEEECDPRCSRAVAKRVIPAAFREARSFLAEWEPVVRKVADRLLGDGTLRPKQLYPLLPQELRPAPSMREGIKRVWDRATREGRSRPSTVP